MSDQIIIYRNVKDEYIPRFSILSGGDFATLLSAVKALDYRKFDQNLKAWAVNLNGLRALKGMGFTVKPMPLIRVANPVERPGGDLKGNHYAEVAIEYLNNQHEYFVLKSASIKYATDEEREAAVARIVERVAAACKQLTDSPVRDLAAWKSVLTALKNETLGNL